MQNQMIDGETLEQLKAVDVQTVDRDTLVDITKININSRLDTTQRRKEFVEKVRNPYCFKVGEVVVKVGFSNEGDSFEKRFEEMLMKLG